VPSPEPEIGLAVVRIRQSAVTVADEVLDLVPAASANNLDDVRLGFAPPIPASDLGSLGFDLLFRRPYPWCRWGSHCCRSC